MNGKRCKALKLNKEQCTRSVYHQSEYCWQHQFSRRQNAPWYKNTIIQFFIGIAIAFISILISVLIAYFGPTKENQEKILVQTKIPSPISRSAERIDLGTGIKKPINNFLIRNIGEVDLYQVTVKLQLESEVLSLTNNDIRVDMIDVPKGLEIPIPCDSFNQVLATTHGMIFSGLDTCDHEAFWVQIDHLAPQESAAFRIRNQSFKVLPPGEHCLFTSVAFYTNVLPATMIFNDGSPVLGISPSSRALGIKSLGSGIAQIIETSHTALIDGADIVTNATYLMHAGKWDEARRELSRAIQQNPLLGIAYNNRSIVFRHLSKAQEAYEDSVKAVALLPDDPYSHATLAQCLRGLGQYDEALSYYNTAISIAGTNMPGLFYERGCVLNDMHRPVEARRDLGQAILLGCTNEWLYFQRALGFLNEQSYSNAIADFSTAITKHPNWAEAYYYRSMAFIKSGQLSLANQDLTKAIKLKPSITNNFQRDGIRTGPIK